MRIEKCPFCAAYLHWDEGDWDALVCWNCGSRVDLPGQSPAREISHWFDEHLPDANGVGRLLIIGLLGSILLLARQF